MSDADDTDPSPPTGAWLAVDRKVLGISQQHMADLLGISHLTIRNWERGRLSPGAGVMRDWAALVTEHTAQAEALARTDGTWQIRTTTDHRYPPGWAVAVAARARDIRRTLGLPDPVIDWAPTDPDT